MLFLHKLLIQNTKAARQSLERSAIKMKKYSKLIELSPKKST